MCEDTDTRACTRAYVPKGCARMLDRSVKNAICAKLAEVRGVSFFCSCQFINWYRSVSRRPCSRSLL